MQIGDGCNDIGKSALLTRFIGVHSKGDDEKLQEEDDEKGR